MIGIAIDIGTMGIRAQALDLDGRGILSTLITRNHPIPGNNVIDQLRVARRRGTRDAQRRMAVGINAVIANLGVERGEIESIAVTGNPTETSLLLGLDTSDLLFWGRDRRPVTRDGMRCPAASYGIEVGDGVELLVPPAIEGHVGADALAMIHGSGMLEDGCVSLATDYGANAEMALKIDDTVLTSSAAAGSAIEGMHIRHGMLAAPGAIFDIDASDDDLRCRVLDQGLGPADGKRIDLTSGELEAGVGIASKGITGTGVISTIAVALDRRLFRPPRITTGTGRLHLQDGIFLDERDVSQAFQAFCAISAGHLALVRRAGIDMADIVNVYAAGATGAYMDVRKAMRLHLLPGCSGRVSQVGNTSLGLSRELVLDPGRLDEMQELAEHIRGHHVLFANNADFERFYILELSRWLEGMPDRKYHDYLRSYQVGADGWEPGRAELVRMEHIELGTGTLKVLTLEHGRS